MTLPAETLIWSDEFEDGPVNARRWRFEDMTEDGQHRVGNEGRPGWRHAARYDRIHAELARCVHGALELRSAALDIINPHRRNVEHAGITHRYGDLTFVTCWLDTCGRRWSNRLGRHQRTEPAQVFVPGMRLEARVSFAAMSAPGARASIWFMPDPELEAQAYDGQPATGAEMDVFEYDVARPYLLQCKVIGGHGAQTAGGSVDLRRHGIDPRKGWHVVEFVWTNKAVVWIVDGHEILRDTVNVPQVPHYLIVSQELNSGAKLDPRPGEMQADPPLVPHDPGLYAVSVAAEPALLKSHVFRMEHLRIYRLADKPTLAERQRQMHERAMRWLADRRRALADRAARFLNRPR